MWDGITLVVQNIGIPLETTILFVVMLGGMMFYAKDFKLGLLIQSITTGLLFVWFYTQSMDWAPSLILFLITFVIMCFSLYAVSKQGARGAII